MCGYNTVVLGACPSNGKVRAGAPGEQIKEGEEEVAGTTFDEPDEEMRGPPLQPEGLSAKGLYAALSGLHGVPAPRGALRLASNPFALNAAPSAYLDRLLEPLRNGNPPQGAGSGKETGSPGVW